ncbi:hypothetical protein C8J57DRAFT_817 [Mycena rebaudengoi]|nr:hypothetical protein C8J57DRAFT_817 [Mycena rebaudengoi]
MDYGLWISITSGWMDMYLQIDGRTFRLLFLLIIISLSFDSFNSLAIPHAPLPPTYLFPTHSLTIDYTTYRLHILIHYALYSFVFLSYPMLGLFCLPYFFRYCEVSFIVQVLYVFDY